jgi:hypothetical protein
LLVHAIFDFPIDIDHTEIDALLSPILHIDLAVGLPAKITLLIAWGQLGLAHIETIVHFILILIDRELLHEYLAHFLIIL